MLLWSLGLAGLVEYFLWGHRAGLGWLLLVVMTAVAANSLRVRLRRPLALWVTIPWGCALAFALAMLWHDGKVVHELGPYLLSVSLGIAVFFSVTGAAPLESLTCSWTSLLNLPAVMFEVVDAGLESRQNTRSGPALGSVLKGLVMVVPLLILFGALFMAADPGYSLELGRLLDHAWEVIPASVRWLLFGLFFLGSARYLARSAASGSAGIPRAGDPLALAVVLAGLNLLFASFLVCQSRYLFAGQAPPGLSLAEYARHGFFELFWASVLVLALIIALYTRLYLQPGSGLARFLAAILVGLTFGLVASCVRRMDLYILGCGLTLTRAYVEATLVGIVGTLALTLTALARCPHPAWLTSRVLLLGMVSMAVLGLVDMERWVAETNVVRCGSKLDVEYLGQLSADVLPVLDRLAQRRDDLRIARQAWAAAVNLRHELQERDWRDWNQASSLPPRPPIARSLESR